MRRVLFIWLLVGLTAVGLGLYRDWSDAVKTLVAGAGFYGLPARETAPSPAGSAKRTAPPAPGLPPAPAAPTGPAAGPIKPSFDVVRVAPGGNTVMAGRAAPDATVIVRDAEATIGTVKADRRGEWVFVPDKPLPPGPHELSLEMQDGGKKTAESDTVVVLAVPAGPALSPRAPAEALAVAVPRDELGPSRILQHPKLPPETARAGSEDGPQRTAALARTRPEPNAVLSTVEEEAASRSEPGPAGASPQTAPTTSGPPAPSTVQRLQERAGPGPGDERLATVGTRHDGGRPEPSATSATGLTIATVDYDDKGNMALSGKASPGATVKIYLNDRLIGQAAANRAGAWELTPPGDVAPGEYVLRADEIRPSGELAGRIRLPFARADMSEDLPPGALVVVQPGNSLWRIARRVYGRGIRYTVIYEANRAQIRDPDRIYPGQIFSLPEAH